MNSADIKREILMSSDQTGIRKRLVSGQGGIDSNDVVEMGIALEGLTKQAGWTFVEAYILKSANPVGLLLSGNDDPLARGKAQGLILLMQWVQQTILAKNEILAARNAKKEEVKEE